MPDGEALEVVEAGEAAGGDGVELAADTVVLAGEVDKVGDAVGPADERVGLEGEMGSEENGVVAGDEVVH